MANHFILRGKNPQKAVIIFQLRQIFKLAKNNLSMVLLHLSMMGISGGNGFHLPPHSYIIYIFYFLLRFLKSKNLVDKTTWYQSRAGGIFLCSVFGGKQDGGTGVLLMIWINSWTERYQSLELKRKQDQTQHYPNWFIHCQPLLSTLRFNKYLRRENY